MKKSVFVLLLTALLLSSCTSFDSNITDITDDSSSSDSTDSVDPASDDTTEDPTSETTQSSMDTPPSISDITDQHIIAALGKVPDLGNITAAKFGGKICIFLGSRLISYDEFSKLHLVEYGGDWRLFGEIVRSTDSSISSITAEGISNQRVIVQKAEFIDNYLVSTHSVYTWDLEHIFTMGFGNQIYLETITDTLVTDKGIDIVGIDRDGRRHTYSYDRTADSAQIYGLKADEEIIKFFKIYSKENGIAGSLTMTMELLPTDIVPFGNNNICQIGDSLSYLIENKKPTKTVEGSYNYIVGDFLVSNKDMMGGISVVYDDEFEPITNGYLTKFSRLSDGRYIAMSFDYQMSAEDRIYYLWDSDGSLIYSGNRDMTIMDIGENYILAKDKNQALKLFTPDFSQLCEFGEMKESYTYHNMLSGVYTKDEKEGYYFIFEDSSQMDEQNNYRAFEYYYIPETKESGLIENGYQGFAYAKPVMYLYPTEETEVTVRFTHPERLTTVYPAYKDKWRVNASPDGILTDENGRSYYALYWEEKSENSNYTFDEGFCVASENSAKFLEEKLSQIGFTELEANEFIIYWLPILEQNEYNLISFELTKERESSNALIITPKPDSLLRMAMHIKGLEAPHQIKEQIIPEFDRKGFAAIEWGGSIH